MKYAVLTESAEDGAIRVFGKKSGTASVAAADRGSGGSWLGSGLVPDVLAVVDPTGKVLDTTVIYPTAPQNKVEESKKVLKKLIEKYHVTVISLGNGTASRESEQIIVELLKENPQKASYVIVNESRSFRLFRQQAGNRGIPEL